MNHPRIVAIVQARMASRRLPGKILADIAGEPMLRRVVERLRRAKSVDEVVVATTLDPADDETEAFCQKRNYPSTRGDVHDVLDRCYQAARLYRAEVIVRITADCPVIDPNLVDQAVSAFLGYSPGGKPPGESAAGKFAYDFLANRLPPPWGRSYPIGLDTEVCAFEGLERAWSEATEPHQREHVMPYLYEGIPPEALRPFPQPVESPTIAQAISPRGFRVGLLHHYPDYGWMRWTVDTAEDLELLRLIYARFDGRDDFSWLEVLDLLQREPGLVEINAAVIHKHYRDIDERR